MKLVLLTYYVGVHNEVMEFIEKHGICTYTRWREVEGRISCGEPREGTHVWPGVNSALFVVVEADRANSLIAEIEEFNRGSGDQGIDVYVLDVARKVTAGEA
jgi:hypothetical protein